MLATQCRISDPMALPVGEFNALLAVAARGELRRVDGPAFDPRAYVDSIVGGGA